MGQPSDYAMTTCVVGMRLGEMLGFDDATLRDVYYETLLRYVGCNAETYWLASIVATSSHSAPSSRRSTLPTRRRCAVSSCVSSAAQSPVRAR
jgi:hypothetical protein